jgi:hypothetical protein
MPPGCLSVYRDNPGSNVPNDVMKIKNELDKWIYLRWVPESDIHDLEGTRLPETELASCAKIYSKTFLPKAGATVIVGESCNPTYRGTCTAVGSIHSSSHCPVKTGKVVFGQSTGFHRTLNSSVVLNHGEENVVGYQWLPKQIFSEPDELDRKLHAKAKSISSDINIENPSAISPPQIVESSKFPIPVHSRVNAPLVRATDTHYNVKVPQTVWMSTPGACSGETVKLADSAGIPKEARFKFALDKVLLRTDSGKAHYAETQIPTGKAQDLMLAVIVTAVTATSGALAIFLASIL